MKTNRKILLILIICVCVAADQATKAIASISPNADDLRT